MNIYTSINTLIYLCINQAASFFFPVHWPYINVVKKAQFEPHSNLVLLSCFCFLHVLHKYRHNKCSNIPFLLLSLTPATPSSDDNLTPSPRKPTPPHTAEQPLLVDTPDGSTTSPQMQTELPFPEVSEI